MTIEDFVLLVLIGMIFMMFFNPQQFAVYSPRYSEPKEVDLSSGSARVTILEYDSRKRNTYTYNIKLINVPENNDGYCYLETDPILWRGQRYATYTWRIEGLKLKAPIKGNMCYFNDWQMVNPAQAKYVYTECSSVGCLTTTMDCEKRDCLNFAIPEAKKISGRLYLKLSPQSPQPPQTPPSMPIEESSPIDTPQPQTQPSFLDLIIQTISNFIRGILSWFGVRF